MIRQRQWRYHWSHPSGDFSCGRVDGLHRTERSAKQAVVRTLTSSWPPTGGARRPNWSMGQVSEGILELEAA